MIEPDTEWQKWAEKHEPEPEPMGYIEPELLEAFELMDTRKLIFDNVSDLIIDFLYYDRKEDEDLRRGDIEKAIESKKITIKEIVDEFEKELRSAIEE